MEDEQSSSEGEEKYVLIPFIPLDGRSLGCNPIVIICLLGVASVIAAIIVPNFVRSRSRGSLTACKSNLKNIGTAYEMYATDNLGHYPKTMAQLTPKYLKTLPECSTVGSVTYRAYTGQGPNNNPGFEDYYYLECHGKNHTNVSVSGNYPAYDGISGLIERP